MVSNTAIDMTDEGVRTLVSKFADAFVGFIGLVIFANVLGASGLGIYYLALALATIAARPASGIGVAVEKRGSAMPTELPTYTTTGLVGALIYSIVSAVLIGSIYVSVPLLQDLQISGAIVGSTIALFVVLSTFTVLNRSYSGHGEPGKSVSIDTGRGVLETGLQLGFLWGGFGVTGLLIGSIISTLTACGYLIFRTSISLSLPSRAAFFEIWSFAKWSIPTRTAEDVYRRMDTVIIGVILTPAAVGIYEAAMRLVKPSKYVSYAIQRPLLVRVSQDESDGKSVLNTVGPYASVLAVPTFAGGLFVGRDLLDILYGTEFASGAPILIGGALYYVLFTHGNVLAEFLHGLDKPQDVTLSILSGSVIRFPALIICISVIGLPGVVVAIILAEIARSSLLWISIYRRYAHLYTPSNVLLQSISATVMCLFVAPLVLYGPISSTTYLSGVILCGGLVYLSFYLMFDTRARTKVQELARSLIT